MCFCCRQFAQILCRISLCVFCCNYGWQLKRKRKFFLIIIFVNEYLFNIQCLFSFLCPPYFNCVLAAIKQNFVL